MAFRNVSFVALLTLGLLASASAHAQDREAARAAFGAGVSAYGEGRYDAALASFQEAYRIAPHPSVRVNMANCYEQLGRPVEALNHFERFLIESENASADQRAEVRSAIARLQAQVGEVFLRVTPEGASVTIDDDTTLRAPILDGIKLVAGEHRLRVESEGYAPYEQTFTLEGGGRQEVAVQLEGAVSTEVEAPDEVDDGEGFSLPTPVWISAGASAALGIGAIISGVLALRSNSDFDDAVADSNDLSLGAAERARAREDGLDAKDRADRRSTAADVLGIASIAAAGTAVVLYFVLRGADEDEPSAYVAPAVGPNAAGVALTGSF
ncbi:MAG: PEGA domain-containing protein [Myxococcota bacterium]